MLVIVPASGDVAYSHFRETVEVSWNIVKLKKRLMERAKGYSLPKDLEARLSSVGEFVIWGAIPGSRAIERFWDRLNRGRGEKIVAFYRRGRIVCWGRIFAWIHDRVLAEALWGRDKHGRTWEYVYFIKDLCWAEIPWDALRRELGYNSNFTPQGHQVVRDEIIEKITSRYGSIWRFLESLAGVRCRNDSASVSGLRSFNVESLQLPAMGSKLVEVVRNRIGVDVDNVVDALLILYGWGTIFLIDCCLNQNIVPKDLVEDLERKLFGSVVARFYNDLRRLGVLTTGSSSNWGRGDYARITSITRDIARCLEVLREAGVEGLSVDLYKLVSSLVIVNCLVGNQSLESDAGVCMKIRRNDFSGTKMLGELVYGALRYLRSSGLLAACLMYGASIVKLRTLLEMGQVK